MRKTTPALAVAALTCAAHAQVNLIDLLPGYTLGGMYGLSADGSTFGVDMFVSASVAYDAYAWRDGVWSSLPRHNYFNNWQGVSGDGSTTLSVSNHWGNRAELVRMQNGQIETIAFAMDNSRVNGALTRDGQTVFYNRYSLAPDPSGPVELYRFNDGSPFAQPLATLSSRFSRGGHMIAGDRDDFFVINAELAMDQTGVGGTHRTLVYDAGLLTEISTLSNADIIHFGATAMTADGSIIVGTESSRSFDNFDYNSRSWMYRDGQLSEILIDGFSQLSIRSITDDATAMVGSGIRDTGEQGSYVFYNDGRLFSAVDLLSLNGIVLGTGENASIEGISADGSTVYGAISLGTWSPFGPEWTLFTVSVPAPSSVLCLCGLAVLGRRRRD